MDDRSQAELVVKTIAFHVAVLASVGHLISLQRQSWHRSRDTIWQLVWFIAVPTYPSALPVERAVQTAKIYISNKPARTSLSHCIDSVLGLHVEMSGGENGASIPLLAIPWQDLSRVSQKRKLALLGRLLCYYVFSYKPSEHWFSRVEGSK